MKSCKHAHTRNLGYGVYCLTCGSEVYPSPEPQYNYDKGQQQSPNEKEAH